MIILEPNTITSAEITTTNVAITETAWAAGTHDLGTQRYVGETVYEVVAEPSTADEPTAGVLADPATWIEVGPINRLKMFDPRIADQTVNATTIEVDIVAGTMVTGVALFGLSGNDVQIEVTDSIDGLVFDETISLQDDSAITDWYAYFFEEFTLKSQIAVLGLPLYRTATISLTITAEVDAKCGYAILGKERGVGDAVFGVRTGIQNYSLKERDVFGNFYINERGFSRDADYPVKILTANYDSTLNLLERLRNTAVAFIGDPDRLGTMTVGYYKDFDLVMAGPEISDLNIEVEGLI